MRLRKHIYFKDQKAYDYLIKQPNFSSYVESLILKDMKLDKEKTSSISKEEVVKIIEEYLSCKNENQIDSDILNSINNLLEFN